MLKSEVAKKRCRFVCNKRPRPRDRQYTTLVQHFHFVFVAFRWCGLQLLPMEQLAFKRTCYGGATLQLNTGFEYMQSLLQSDKALLALSSDKP